MVRQGKHKNRHSKQQAHRQHIDEEAGDCRVANDFVVQTAHGIQLEVFGRVRVMPHDARAHAFPAAAHTSWRIAIVLTQATALFVDGIEPAHAGEGAAGLARAGGARVGLDGLQSNVVHWLDVGVARVLAIELAEARVARRALHDFKGVARRGEGLERWPGGVVYLDSRFIFLFFFCLFLSGWFEADK